MARGVPEGGLGVLSYCPARLADPEGEALELRSAKRGPRDAVTGCCYGMLLRDAVTGCCNGMLLRDAVTGCCYGMLLLLERTLGIFKVGVSPAHGGDAGRG